MSRYAKIVERRTTEYDRISKDRVEGIRVRDPRNKPKKQTRIVVEPATKSKFSLVAPALADVEPNA